MHVSCEILQGIKIHTCYMTSYPSALVTVVTGTSGLPDMYTRSSRAMGGQIRQNTSACVTTIIQHLLFLQLASLYL